MTRDFMQPSTTALSTGSQWFAVTLVFLSRIKGAPTLRPLVEERVVLIRTRTEADARSKAATYAKGEKHSYPNMYGQTVTWEFVRIEKLEKLGNPQNDGPWEVASRFVRRNLARLKKGKSAQKRKAVGRDKVTRG